MIDFSDLGKEAARSMYSELMLEYNKYCAMGLKLDLSRGKPNSEQLDFSKEMLLAPLDKEQCISSAGFDYRNYGMVDGIKEAKVLFADLLGLNYENVIVGGNSSLQLMYDAISRAMLFGTCDSTCPWCREDKLKWICVTPGYDRHFKITEEMGFELISVRMMEDGPDMDTVEELVKDPSVKGIWCVPKYSNPTGNTYSDETVRRLAAMKCAAPDFRIMWDNAYAVHDFSEDRDELSNIFEYAKEYGTEDRILYFASTSKITFPGSGIAMVCASDRNIADIKKRMGVQTIGYDKINQLRHVLYFGSSQGIKDHMDVLGRKIKEKFDITLDSLSALKGAGIAEWTEPKGGYFVSLDIKVGSAKRVYQLMKDAGVVLTQVGATYPYGIDPLDSNLRIAPTYPSDADLKLACDMLVLCIKISALEKLLNI
jgi:DNA-binding transcriptional MocR family regulator